MAADKRIRVAVIYGGRSSEHEISLQSARSVIDHLARKRFEVLPIAIDRDGTWYAQDLKRIDSGESPALPVDASTDSTVALEPRPGESPLSAPGAAGPVDVVFPVMPGPLCEDGSIQGLLELAAVPYVGAGVLGSAVCMDKDVAKRLARSAGIESAPYVSMRLSRWLNDPDGVRAQVADDLDYPVFVKPANQGSSIGIHRVTAAAELEAAIEDALRYDTKVLIEQAVDAREIELAVLGAADPSAPPEVSLPGEIVATEAFYSFERKYIEEDGAELHVPADLTPEQQKEAQRIAAQIFLELECDGMARIDLFLDRQSGRLLFNEANTIPGFTAISMYPKLWEASGLPYGALLTRLIELALARAERRSALKRDR